MLQNSGPAVNSQTGQTLWEPPPVFGFRQLTRPTIPKEMVSALRVGDFKVVLDDTPLAALQKRFGGEIGQRGDAGDALSWLCLTGGDRNGLWILWAESSEIDGPNVGGIRWRRVAQTETVDHRCGQVFGDVSMSPTMLNLGEDESDLFRALGRPWARRGDQLLFSHEHKTTIHNEPYTVDNDVYVTLHDGAVAAITVIKTTSD